MALLLNIDTATAIASVGFSDNGHLLAQASNHEQMAHAAFLQPAIDTLCHQLNLQLTGIDAVSVTIGPGSYTGLRVGLASAKGICFALNKPLIGISTLEVMALAANQAWNEMAQNQPVLLVPMIDARRQEVFTAIYDPAGQTILPPQALILDPTSFDGWLEANTLVFSGDGSIKWQAMCQHSHAYFVPSQHSAAHLAILAERAYANAAFLSLAYSEPLYLKDFYKP